MGDRLTAKPPSAYAAAADPRQYRVADAAVALCRRHGAAAVLCATAGKEGRRGGTAAVGATLFWLTCPHLNAVVARFERNGAVAALQRLVERDPMARAAHVASHERFERCARALLCAERWDFFAAHFAAEGAVEGTPHRKFGNAGVARAADVKCLHALVAQSLGGARNAIGDAVLRHVRALAQSCETNASSNISPNVSSNVSPNVSPNAASNVAEKCAQEKREALDGVDALVALVAEAAAEEAKERVEEEKEKEKEMESANDGAGEPMDADELCRAAGLLLTFLEGREPRARRKRRIN